MKKISNRLYSISRTVNKIASTVNDIETVATGNQKKIMKRIKRKTVGKALNKVTKTVMNKLV